MTPLDAASHYRYLEDTAPIGAAASFARDYENGATDADFDAYLRYLDLMYGSQEGKAA